MYPSGPSRDDRSAPKIRWKARASARSDTRVADAVGIHVADSPMGSSPASSQGRGDGDLGAAPFGIEAAAGHRVATRAAAEHLAMNHGPALQGVLPLLQDQDPGTLAGHPAVAPPIERPARLARVPLPVRHVVEQGHPDQAQRMDLRVGPAGDHHVGPPRAMIRAASAIARLDEASASVIVLLGPWQSIRIEMWQASMLGRYFSSQIGSIMPIDSRPQAWKSNAPDCGVGLADRRRQLVELAGDQARAQVDADPGRIDAALDPARRRRTASWPPRPQAGCREPCTSGSCVAPCMNLAARAGRLQEVEIDGSRRRRRWAGPSTENASSGAPPPGPRPEIAQNAVRTITQGSHQAQTGYDHAAFGTKHESLVDLRRIRSRASS